MDSIASGIKDADYARAGRSESSPDPTSQHLPMTATQTRQVYLISFPSHNSRDHWGLYFPSTISPKRYGKILHVLGSPQFGFKYEVRHNWDTEERSTTPFRLHLLGETDAGNIVDRSVNDDWTRESGTSMVVVNDLNKEDKFENLANRHPPPKVASGLIPTGPSKVLLALQKDIPGMRRCQEWTSDFIDDLVKHALLPEFALKERDAIRAARTMPPEA